VPAEGERAEHDGHRLLVTELDGRRIARVRVSPPAPGPGGRPDHDVHGDGSDPDPADQRSDHDSPQGSEQHSGQDSERSRTGDRQWWKATG
jgi:putative hemolysin